MLCKNTVQVLAAKLFNELLLILKEYFLNKVVPLKISSKRFLVMS